MMVAVDGLKILILVGVEVIIRQDHVQIIQLVLGVVMVAGI